VGKENKIVTEDRRRFFRINDEVNLYYRVVDEQTVVAIGNGSNKLFNSGSLATSFEVLDQESKLLMHRIEKEYFEIAEYLKIVSAKVDLIAQETMKQGYDVSDDDIRNANISASGVAFESKSQVKAGEFLEIKLLLSSSFALIVIYGKVIHCKSNEDKKGQMPFQIGLNFVNIQDQDRELLVKHVVKRQMQQIREKKEN
jgi:hypothetical protein